MESENIRMAYLAGMMDGDGSFSIIKHKTEASPLYYPFLQFVSWKKVMIDALKIEFGGSVTTAKPCIRKDGSMGHIMYRWRIRSHDNVKPILEKLIPYLRIKSERASFLLSFIEETPFIRGKRLSEEALVDKERAYIKMIQSNDWTSLDNNLTTKLAKDISDDSTFWSYLAGIMDTDGSFSVKCQKQNKGTHVKNHRYLPVISISSTDTRAINYIRENFPMGKLYIPRNKDCSARFHYQYGIYTKKECIEFLKRIIPFLKGKKDNAELLLHFCENSVNTGYCRAGISADELKFRHDCYIKLVELNKYGVSKSPLIDLKPLPDNAEGNKAEAAKACTVNVVSEETSKEDAVL